MENEESTLKHTNTVNVDKSSKPAIEVQDKPLGESKVEIQKDDRDNLPEEVKVEVQKDDGHNPSEKVKVVVQNNEPDNLSEKVETEVQRDDLDNPSEEVVKAVVHYDEQGNPSEEVKNEVQNDGLDNSSREVKAEVQKDYQDSPSAKVIGEDNDKATVALKYDKKEGVLSNEMKVQVDLVANHQEEKVKDVTQQDKSDDKMHGDRDLVSKDHEETRATTDETPGLGEHKEPEPIFDGTEVPDMEAQSSPSTRSLDLDPETQGNVWPDKAVAIKNFVLDKSAGAVTSVMRRLSGKKDEDEVELSSNEEKVVVGSAKEDEAQENTQKSWNPLYYLKFSRDADSESKVERTETVDETLPIVMKGRILLYTRLGCQDCQQARLFLFRKRLRYVEINIDVYPSRKLELEKISGSSIVPKIFFNEILIGGLTEIKNLEETGKLKDKIDYLIAEAPSPEAPLPPLSGEDDVSGSGAIDELAVIVRKMKESIAVKDRFYKMRWFNNCFLGSDAVDFISEDQYLEREEAVEFGQKLASKLFFQHVLDENVFEDGGHLYRFLDQDPIVSSQCYNIPRGIIEVKPKPIVEIASRLRFLSCAIFDAYTSVDGKHVDYRSIHGSEEFARYLRTVEELQRVELLDMSREEKLAFFINLYNMMAIHAILVWGHPAGPLERRKMFGDFKYVIGGCTYSLSAIQNGILRGNQRPPYNLMKPFGLKDKRSKVALPYPEPLMHFALVCGARSGPALRCYSPRNIDKELMEAARDFIRGGGLTFDVKAKVAIASKILKWFSVDFGKNEVELLKHASNYLEPADSEMILESLASTQLKVTYQPFDWGLNC